MAAYYNEIDPFAAAWLRALIAQGLIAAGEVDERSIVDVRRGDLAGFSQCHFFAGIGGWSYALRLAGVADDAVVWTGSCPCQPFSSAGKGRGKDDARHLWPQFRRLIRQCRPPVVFGEQVASKAGRVWLSAVFADLEALAYRAAGADLCGPSVGAFDIRRRVWFVADTERRAAERHRQPMAGTTGRAQGETHQRQRLRLDAGNGGDASALADATVSGGGEGREGGSLPGREQPERSTLQLDRRGASRIWADDIEWIPCTDGKARPTQSGLFPLATGVSHRVGRLRGYGNAIKPQVAAEFVRAYLEVA